MPNQTLLAACVLQGVLHLHLLLTD